MALNKSVTRAPLPKRKLILGTLLFLASTIAVFAYLWSQTADSSGPTWSGLRWPFGLLLLLVLPLDPMATGARMYIVCRVLGSKVSFWTCFKADCANFTVSTLTPGQSGGGAAQVYMLQRDGVPLGTAWTATMLSFLGTLVGLAVIGVFALLFANLEFVSGALFTSAVWVIALSVLAMGLAAYAPALLRRPIGMLSRALARLLRREDRLLEWRPVQSADPALVDRMGRFAGRVSDIVYAYSHDFALFLRNGKLAFFGVVLTTLVFLLTRALVAYLCLRFLGLDGGLFEVLGIQLALTFVVYFSPTPGGAGISESVSLIAMAAFVPAGFAPHYNLLWRFTTIYVWAIAGGLILLQTVCRRRRKNHAPSTTGEKNND